MKDRVKGLIEVLLDPTAREDEIGDAIMDLGGFSDLRALTVLLEFGSNQNEPNDILEDCGESIGRIYIAIDKKVDEKAFEKLTPIARETALAYIISHKPELINQPL